MPPVTRNLAKKPEAALPEAVPALAPLTAPQSTNHNPAELPPGVAKAGLNVPSWAQEGPEAEQKGPPVAYVGQLQTNSGCLEKAQEAGVKLGDYYLSDKDGIKGLGKSPRFFVMRLKKFWTQMDAGGKITGAKDYWPGKDAGFDGHYVMVIVVDVNGVLYPVKADFRKASEKVGRFAEEGLAFAANPAFLDESPDHKAAAGGFPYAFGRVVVELSVEKKTSKKSGKPYYESVPLVVPATPQDQKRLLAAFENEGFNALVEEAGKNFEKRCNMIEKKIVK